MAILNITYLVVMSDTHDLHMIHSQIIIHVSGLHELSELCRYQYLEESFKLFTQVQCSNFVVHGHKNRQNLSIMALQEEMKSYVPER